MKYTIDEALDLVLLASGSRLAYHTMPATLDNLREAMRDIMSASYIEGSNEAIRIIKLGS